MMVNESIVVYLGVPPAQMQPGLRFPLQVCVLITGLAGFPLQSVTRNIEPLFYIGASATNSETGVA